MRVTRKNAHEIEPTVEVGECMPRRAPRASCLRHTLAVVLQRVSRACPSLTHYTRSFLARSPTTAKLPPPPEIANQYFYKDFGEYGLFVGICTHLLQNGHKNGRDDVYYVR